jgi:hypothetical protein
MLEIDFSQQFMKAFTVISTRVGECDCGKTHVVINAFDDDDVNDLEMIAYYESQAEEDASIIIDYSGDGYNVDMIAIGNHEWVNVCECRGWERYMDWVLANRMQIKDFLLGVSKEVERVAAFERTLAVLKDTTLSH